MGTLMTDTSRSAIVDIRPIEREWLLAPAMSGRDTSDLLRRMSMSKMPSVPNVSTVIFQCI